MERICHEIYPLFLSRAKHPIAEDSISILVHGRVHFSIIGCHFGMNRARWEFSLAYTLSNDITRDAEMSLQR